MEILGSSSESTYTISFLVPAPSHSVAQGLPLYTCCCDHVMSRISGNWGVGFPYRGARSSILQKLRVMR